MLARNSYPRSYIDATRRRITDEVMTFRRLAHSIDASEILVDLENVFFNNLLVVLDASFIHRTRAVEGKDGNPLNEVRVLAASILENGGVMGTDSTIKLDPPNTVLGYQRDDEITLDEDDFTRLADAFFADLEAKFAE